jgi:hypothetical protein
MAQGFAWDQEIINILGGDPVNAYGENNAVVPSTETTLASYTISNPEAILKGVYGFGDTDGRFKLYVNSTSVWEGRNAWTQRLIWTLVEKSLVSGDVVELKVTNLKGTNHRFTGGFYVYEL